MNKVAFFLTIVLSLFTTLLFGQSAEKLLRKAEKLMDENKASEAAVYYQKVLAIDSFSYPKVAITLSRIYLENNRFDESMALCGWFGALEGQKPHLTEIADNIYKTASFRKNAVALPLDFDPINLGDSINSESDEYVNQYILNGHKLLYTRSVAHIDGNREESLHVNSKPIEFDWDFPCNIGAFSVSSDGKEMYFSGCGIDSGCDIYVSFLNEKGKWSQPQNVGWPISTSSWESQPCLSYDGKELYFVRRSSKAWTTDLYVSHRNDDGTWSTPMNLGENVNTDKNEMAPFLHPDMQTLYFSSDGHVGMGGFDLFMSRRTADGGWSKAVNLGYPLNTSDDEINLVVSPDASKGYISSRREGGLGGYDLYVFDLDDSFKPLPIEKGEPIVLENILFNTDSYVLDSVSYDEISRIASYLKIHDDIFIEISGHTDDTGDAEHNLILSRRRAESVKNALIDSGISRERIIAEGYGDTKPIASNDSEESRAKNRRTEMRVIEAKR